MGKRSTSTTKSGKYMNPTDQARKEARKRELKKNKKQRQLVRTAVLKGKNPRELIVELEKIDDMEFNPLAPPPLNAKVLGEKRRKLIETWNRVLKMYEKDEPDQLVDLKKVWSNYLVRKNELVNHYESVRNAQNVRIDDIPLPMVTGPGDIFPMTDIPLPPMGAQPKSGILKKSSLLDSVKPKTCPGVPVGPPPLLSDYFEDEAEVEAGAVDSEKEPAQDNRPRKIRFAEDEEDDDDDAEEDEAEGDDVGVPGEEEPSDEPEPIKAAEKPKVDDLQKRMLAMAGQDVDAYLQEMEKVHRETQAEKAKQFQSRMEKLQQTSDQPRRFGQAPPGPPPGPPPAFGPPGMLMRPGLPPPGVRLPPGPPPGRPPLRMPPGPPPGIPPALTGARLPPMPRPLMPSSTIRNPAVMAAPPSVAGVVSAAPQIIQKEAQVASTTTTTPSATGPVIEAKPQMRNLLNDVTRFVPTKVKVQLQHEKGGPETSKKSKSEAKPDVFSKHSQPASTSQLPNKDDAYAQFMKEMEHMMK